MFYMRQMSSIYAFVCLFHNIVRLLEYRRDGGPTERRKEGKKEVGGGWV